MFRVTGLWSAVGAVIIGLMLADLIAPAHVAGTKALAHGLTQLEKQTGNQLIGAKG